MKVQYADGRTEEHAAKYGEIKLIPLGLNEEAKLVLHPEKGFDAGGGRGKEIDATVKGGIVGMIIDCRGRPFRLPDDTRRRITALNNWFSATGLYPG
jgi:hypothetical protein